MYSCDMQMLGINFSFIVSPIEPKFVGRVSELAWSGICISYLGSGSRVDAECRLWNPWKMKLMHTTVYNFAHYANAKVNGQRDQSPAFTRLGINRSRVWSVCTCVLIERLQSAGGAAGWSGRHRDCADYSHPAEASPISIMEMLRKLAARCPRPPTNPQHRISGDGDDFRQSPDSRVGAIANIFAQNLTFLFVGSILIPLLIAGCQLRDWQISSSSSGLPRDSEKPTSTCDSSIYLIPCFIEKPLRLV